MSNEDAPSTAVIHVLVGIDERGATDERSTEVPWDQLQQTLDEVRDELPWQSITIVRPADHAKLLGSSDVLPAASTHVPEKRLLCMRCGSEITVTEGQNLRGCPSCGDNEGIPADLDDTVTVTLTRHELRILTIWADNWGHHVDCSEPMKVITERLATQTDTALTMGQEIADVRAAFPGKVTVEHRHDFKMIPGGMGCYCGETITPDQED